LKNKGAQVEAGEPIAQMGNSGITDKGVHLHFEIWHNGFPLNPLDYLTLK
jgi:murein DD-endopeptidase MepM/ murein hydrolase activator NlpD